MNLIEKKVRGEFATWAQENENKDIFPKISQEESSYYIDRSGDETYLMEYSVPNIAQLKADLERYSGLSEDTELSKNWQLLSVSTDSAERKENNMEMRAFFPNQWQWMRIKLYRNIYMYFKAGVHGHSLFERMKGINR